MAPSVVDTMTPATIDPKTVDWTNGMKKAPRDVAWYQATLEKVPEIAMRVFREYSGLPDEEILDHIYKVRDQAWDM
jgi:hypothetical protein